jgi:hypothetical protein
MNVVNTEHKLLAWSPKLSTHYDEDDLTNVGNPEKEPEVVFFPSIRGFAIQPHPEWEEDDSAFNAWVNQQIIKHCFS